MSASQPPYGSYQVNPYEDAPEHPPSDHELAGEEVGSPHRHHPDLPPPPEATFDTKEALEAHMREWSVSHGYTLVVASSQRGGNAKYMRCGRGGKKQNKWGVTDENRQRKRSSVKIGCPMKLLFFRNEAGLWVIQHSKDGSSSVHNHGPLVKKATRTRDEDGNPRQRRSQVTNACTACRNGKLKCDDLQPCGNCQRAGAMCHKVGTRRQTERHWVEPMNPLAGASAAGATLPAPRSRNRQVPDGSALPAPQMNGHYPSQPSFVNNANAYGPSSFALALQQVDLARQILQQEQDRSRTMGLQSLDRASGMLLHQLQDILTSNGSGLAQR